MCSSRVYHAIITEGFGKLLEREGRGGEGVGWGGREVDASGDK